MPPSPAGSTTAAAVSDVVMPKLGLTMTEGVLAEWHVRPGGRVRPGQLMFVVETDKIANEIEAPDEGEILEILVESGETVPVGAPLARWTGKAAAGDGQQPAATEAAGMAVRGATAAAADGARSPAREDATPVPAPGRLRATPLARRIARQNGVELASLAGSGPQGRIKAADVEAALAMGREAAPPEADPEVDTPVAATHASMPAGGDRVAVSSRHLAKARRVTAAKRDIPHFYVTRRADASALLELRRALNAAGGPKVTLNHLLLKAVGRALMACPEANRIWADGALLAFARTDVGVVVDTGEGLFIPILRDVGRQALDALATDASELIARAKSGGLQREDLEGGAVSVSNVGMAGGIESIAPIINPPQSSNLGVGAVSETFRPDAEARPVLARVLVLTLACDHRVLDGMGAARFLDAIVRGLESPHALLRTTDGDD